MGCTKRWTIFEVSFDNSEDLIERQSTHGDCLQHIEALNSARIPVSAFRPLVAHKGFPDITIHLKSKWHVLSFQMNAIVFFFFIQCTSWINYFNFKFYRS